MQILSESKNEGKLWYSDDTSPNIKTQNMSCITRRYRLSVMIKKTKAQTSCAITQADLPLCLSLPRLHT